MAAKQWELDAGADGGWSHVDTHIKAMSGRIPLVRWLRDGRISEPEPVPVKTEPGEEAENGESAAKLTNGEAISGFAAIDFFFLSRLRMEARAAPEGTTNYDASEARENGVKEEPMDTDAGEPSPLVNGDASPGERARTDAVKPDVKEAAGSRDASERGSPRPAVSRQAEARSPARRGRVLPARRDQPVPPRSRRRTSPPAAWPSVPSSATSPSSSAPSRS